MFCGNPPDGVWTVRIGRTSAAGLSLMQVSKGSHRPVRLQGQKDSIWLLKRLIVTSCDILVTLDRYCGPWSSSAVHVGDVFACQQLIFSLCAAKHVTQACVFLVAAALMVLFLPFFSVFVCAFSFLVSVCLCLSLCVCVSASATCARPQTCYLIHRSSELRVTTKNHTKAPLWISRLCEMVHSLWKKHRNRLTLLKLGLMSCYKINIFETTNIDE